jgi:hypothetical protein
MKPVELMAVQGNKLSVTILKETLETEVSGIDEAEDLFLKKVASWTASATQTFNPDKIRGSGSNENDDFAVLPVLICRQANLIAARTRRGAGNVILVHPTRTRLFEESSSAAYSRTTPPEILGNWAEVGCINSSISVYTSTKVPENRIIVVYKGPGEIDASAYVSGVLETGKYYYGVLENNVSALGNFADYVGFVDLENC